MVTLWVKYVFPSILIDSDFDIISVKKTKQTKQKSTEKLWCAKTLFFKKD